jgi:hypothetical protein
MSDEKNYFLYKTQYPDVLSILNGKKLKINDFAKNAIFVIDANSLLLPYGLKKQSLKEIGLIYENLKKNGRLFVPAHALREFAKHRSAKIGELFTEVDKSVSSIPTINAFEYPILADLDAYQRLTKYREEFSAFIKPYKEILRDLQTSINEWNWSDPVTELYGQIFTATNIIETTEEEATLEVEFEDRMKKGVPPGNKDAGKTVNAIGDFLIWKSILELGKSNGWDIALVTDDEKNDWMLKGNKKSVVTRFELVNEYGQHTAGKQFTCLNFANFLKTQGATDEVISEVVTSTSFNTPLNSYLRVKSCLLELKNLLANYLNELLEENDYFIPDKTLSPLVGSLISLLKDDYFDKVIARRELANELTIILPLLVKNNYAVEFETYRAKRSTHKEQADVQSLSKNAIELIEALLIMMY